MYDFTCNFLLIGTPWICWNPWKTRHSCKFQSVTLFHWSCVSLDFYPSFQGVKGEIGLTGKPGPQGRKVLVCDEVHTPVVTPLFAAVKISSDSLLFRGHLDLWAARGQKDSWSVTDVPGLNTVLFCVEIWQGPKGFRGPPGPIGLPGIKVCVCERVLVYRQFTALSFFSPRVTEDHPGSLDTKETRDHQ